MTVTEGPGHFYVRLADDIEGQIDKGVFRAGERLPSIRSLHVERGVSISTVSHAFAELERRGVVEARPRSGYFVRERVPRLEAPRMQRHRVRPRKVPLPLLADDFVASSADPSLVPLGGAVLSPDLIPLKHLARLVKDVAVRDAGTLARYGPPAGAPELRRQIGKRMTEIGCPVDEDEIVVSSGCMDSIRLALMAVTKPGDIVAIESPTFFGFLQLVREIGLYALEIPSDPRTGIDIELLANAVSKHDVSAIVVTPNFQNPTGSVMPDEAKRELAALATKAKIPIVEDDVYGDLHFDRPRPRPIAALAPEADVLYSSSFSKTLAPGLRVGWVVPGRHTPRVRRLKLSGTIASPGLNQLVLADFMSTGSYTRHLRRLRTALKQQTGAALAAIGASFPHSCRATVPTGGFLIWVQLPDDVDSLELYERARRKKISLLPGPLCSLAPRYGSYVRISCGYPWTKEVEQGVQRLGKLIG